MTATRESLETLLMERALSDPELAASTNHRDSACSSVLGSPW